MEPLRTPYGTVRVSPTFLCFNPPCSRVAQWVLGKKNLTAYMGCVGEDSSRKILEEKAREAGVNVRYQVSEKPTGRCAVLITNQNRSLVTKLDAANHFTISHLEEETNWELVKTAK